MQDLSFQLARPVKLKLPPVVRYLERTYVEDFFRTGQLRLTTYAHCQRHECDIRRDSLEGQANFELELDSLGSSGWGVQTVGWQSYMLCGSLSESERLTSRFKVDSYFRINDVIGFYNAISSCVSGFVGGLIGACVYRDEKAFEKPLKFREVSPNFQTSNSSAGMPFAPVEFEMSDEPYFIKGDLFSVEAEFRMIWTVSEDVEGPIVIRCPAAIQFCDPDLEVTDTYKKYESSGDIRSSILAADRFPRATMDRS